jgi:hypothetical protein
MVYVDVSGTQPNESVAYGVWEHTDTGMWVTNVNGVWQGGEEIIEMTGSASPSDDPAVKARIGGTANVMTLDEFERVRNFEKRAEYEAYWTEESAADYWRDFPEKAAEDYFGALNADYNEYLNGTSAELRKGFRRINFAAGVVNFVAGATVAVAGGFYALGAAAPGSVIGGELEVGGATTTTTGASTLPTTIPTSVTATQTAQQAVQLIGGAGGATALANEVEEAPPLIEETVALIETAGPEAEAFIGTERIIAGYDVVSQAQRIGNTYSITISGWYERVGESQGYRALLNALRSDAAAAGASDIEIIGAMVENQGLYRVVEALAPRLGFTFERLTSTYFRLRGPV